MSGASFLCAAFVMLGLGCFPSGRLQRAGLALIRFAVRMGTLSVVGLSAGFALAPRQMPEGWQLLAEPHVAFLTPTFGVTARWLAGAAMVVGAVLPVMVMLDFLQGLARHEPLLRGVQRLLEHLRHTLHQQPDAPLAQLITPEAMSHLPVEEPKQLRRRSLASYLKS
jgi:hypothetical protein